MIEMKANVIKLIGEDGADIDMESHLEGNGRELVHESLAIIRTLMQDLKHESPALHMVIIRELAADPGILRGEEQTDEREQFAKMMAEMTSKAMHGKGELN